MRRPWHRRLVDAAGAAALLLLCACSGLRSDQPPPQVYLLRPSLPAAAAPLGTGAAAVSLAVELPQAGPALADDAIVLLRPGGRLDYYAGVRWAGPVPRLLQALAVDALRATGRFALVQSASGPFASDYLLTLELRDFQAEYGADGPPTVHVALSAALGRRGSRPLVANIVAESRVRADADRMQAVIAAFDAATADALGQLAAAAVVPVAPTP